MYDSGLVTPAVINETCLQLLQLLIQVVAQCWIFLDYQITKTKQTHFQTQLSSIYVKKNINIRQMIFAPGCR